MTAKKQRAVVTSKRGRPSAYREECAEQARKLCLLGATDFELADFFGVSEVTINAWKTRFPEFLKSITRGKLMADAEVAEKLYQRACGYSHPAVKIMQYEGRPIEVEYAGRLAMAAKSAAGEMARRTEG